MKKTIRLKLSELQVYEKVLDMKVYVPNRFMTFSMKHFGQKTEVIVVMRKGKYYIIDGGHRFYSAIEAGNIQTLECRVLDIPDSEILDTRITYNQKTKVHTSEICMNIEHMLGLMGKEQGKRNDLLGIQNIEDEDEYGTAGKDKFEIACMNSGLDFSGRTLRKLMEVHNHEKIDNSLGLIEGIDSGIYSIDAAYKLVKKNQEKIEKREARKKREIDKIKAKVWFKVFEQSSTDLSNLKKYNPNFAMFSPTYLGMKDYRNQGEMKYGQESTLKEYLDNSRKFIDALIDIMDENGVIVIVIGESYAGGYKSIITQYEMMLLESGLEIIGRCPWIKSNSTPVIVKDFFRPIDEMIFVCKMKGAVVNFNPKMKATKEGKKMVKKSHKAKDGTNRYYVQDEETIVSNVITTSVVNDSEYKKYDPNFTHDAPAPMEIYDRFVDSYTLPGMTCIDIHCGSGQGLEVFARHGCNVIGVDIDPVSVEFCNKRMSMLLEESPVVVDPKIPNIKMKTRRTKKRDYSKNDEYYTPKILVDPIISYIPPKSTIWCPCDTENSEFVINLRESGHNVIYGHIKDGKDFFEYEPEHYDYIITNIPFSQKLRFLERLYQLNKPFAVLLNLECLNYNAVSEFFVGKNLEQLIVDKKVSFDGNTAAFNTSYFCNMVLPEKTIFHHLEHSNSGKNFIPSRMNLDFKELESVDNFSMAA